MLVVDCFRVCWIKTISSNLNFLMEDVYGISWKKMKILLKDGFRPV